MKIGGLQRVSLIEYPGKICAIVFMQGCNFNCPYCYNPELVNPDLYGEGIPEKEIFSFLEKRKEKIDAVTITGGEPTIQQDLIEFIKRIRKIGYEVKIDTNGSNPELVEKLIKEKLVNYIAMDIKAPPGKYNMVTKSQIDINKINQSIKLIMKSGIPYEFRTTVLKKLLEKEDILEIGRIIRNANLYILQQFVSSKILDKEYLKYESYSVEELNDLRNNLLNNISVVQVR